MSFLSNEGCDVVTARLMLSRLGMKGGMPVCTGLPRVTLSSCALGGAVRWDQPPHVVGMTIR